MTDTGKLPADYFQRQRMDAADLVPKDYARVLDIGCGFGGLGRILGASGIVR